MELLSIVPILLYDHVADLRSICCGYVVTIHICYDDDELLSEPPFLILYLILAVQIKILLIFRM